MESNMRGLTFRQAINLPYLYTLYITLTFVTILYLPLGIVSLAYAALGIWAFAFSVIWVKWRVENRPHKYGPPFH